MIALSVDHLNLHKCCEHYAFESRGLFDSLWCCKCKGLPCPDTGSTISISIPMIGVEVGVRNENKNQMLPLRSDFRSSDSL